MLTHMHIEWRMFRVSQIYPTFALVSELGIHGILGTHIAETIAYSRLVSDFYDPWPPGEHHAGWTLKERP
jgi:hypothetical protein